MFYFATYFASGRGEGGGLSVLEHTLPDVEKKSVGCWRYDVETLWEVFEHKQHDRESC